MNKTELAKVKAAHEKFLRKMGAHPEQIKAKKPVHRKQRDRLSPSYSKSYFEDKPLNQVLSGDTNAGTKRDIISNLYKLSEKDQKSIKRKSTQVGVLVNKSGYGVITPGMDPKTLGRK